MDETLFVKNDLDWDCRAIPDDFLKRFLGKTGEVSFYPFLQLVKEHKELAIAFRGNDYSGKLIDDCNRYIGKPTNGGAVIIYRNNHAMFTIKPQSVSFNPNYLRYYPNWQTVIKDLVLTYGFNKGKIPVLGPVKKSENSRTHVVAFSCSFEKGSISAPITPDLLSKIDDLYALLTKIFDAFFSLDKEYETDQFLKWGNDNDPVYKGRVIFKKKKIELEKIRQQQLFTMMKNQEDGYLFYDMEFEQKHKSAEEAEVDRKNGLNNKPDMQAIRFDSKGNPVAWVFVEVKCTESAYGGKSSLKNHIEKMRKYIKDADNLNRRRREAYLMLYQYNQLGLLNLNREIDIESFNNLKSEVIIVFTDEAINRWENDIDTSIVELRKKQSNSLGTEFKLEDGSRAILVKDM